MYIQHGGRNNQAVTEDNMQRLKREMKREPEEMKEAVLKIDREGQQEMKMLKNQLPIIIFHITYKLRYNSYGLCTLHVIHVMLTTYRP